MELRVFIQRRFIDGDEFLHTNTKYTNARIYYDHDERTWLIEETLAGGKPLKTFKIHQHISLKSFKALTRKQERKRIPKRSRANSK